MFQTSFVWTIICAPLFSFFTIRLHRHVPWLSIFFFFSLFCLYPLIHFGCGIFHWIDNFLHIRSATVDTSFDKVKEHFFPTSFPLTQYFSILTWIKCVLCYAQTIPCMSENLFRKFHSSQGENSPRDWCLLNWNFWNYSFYYNNFECEYTVVEQLTIHSQKHTYQTQSKHPAKNLDGLWA